MLTKEGSDQCKNEVGLYLPINMLQTSSKFTLPAVIHLREKLAIRQQNEQLSHTHAQYHN